MKPDDKRERGFVTVATKVSPEMARVLNLIARDKGIKVYELMQLVCYFLVRYTSDRHNMSEEMNKLMMMFHNEVGWKDAFNLCNPSADTEVAEEILILQQPGKAGFGAVKIQKPWMGAWLETDNQLDIVERVLEVCLPSVYQHLRELTYNLDCKRVGEALITLADAKTIEYLNEQTRREMEGSVVNEAGRQYQYGQRTKRVPHYSPDENPYQQQTIHFDDDDGDTAEREVHDFQGEYRYQPGEGEHRGNADDGFEYKDFTPFGVEP